jgi:hypothetical protein
MAVIVMGLAWRQPIQWPLFLATVILTSIQFIGLGAALALRFGTVAGYLMGSAGLITPVVAPGMIAFWPDMPFAFVLIPFASAIRLMLVSMHAASASGPEIAVMVTVIVLAAMAGSWLGWRAIAREWGRR